MQRLSKVKVKVGISVILAVLTIVGAMGVNSNYKAYKATEKQSDTLKAELDKQKKEYKKHKKEVSKQALTEGQTSDNSIVKFISDYNGNEILGDTVAERFFKVFYTWNSGEDYNARADELGDLVASGVKENKTLFDSGKDSLGDSYIDTIQLKSVYKDSTVYQKVTNNNQIEMLVEVSYESWRGDSQSKAGDSRTYYKVTYDKATSEINNVVKAYPLKSAR